MDRWINMDIDRVFHNNMSRNDLKVCMYIRKKQSIILIYCDFFNSFQVLFEYQFKWRTLIPNFSFNLGFSGNDFKKSPRINNLLIGVY